jgi:spore maturation protein CgeB
MSKAWLFVGHLLRGQTSLMRMNALKRNSLLVDGIDTRAIWNRQNWLRRQLTTMLECGPAVRKINKEIIDAARQSRPRCVWFDKQEFIWPETMDELKNLGAFLIYYTPDPYFTLNWKRTRLMDSCLPKFDLLITSKSYELEDFRRVGPPVLYLPLGYCDEVHRPMSVSPSDFVSVGFVGGWEPRRQAVLEAIVKQGVSVKVWGYAWDHLIDGRWTPRRSYRLRRLAGSDPWTLKKSEFLQDCIVPGEVYADAYSTALSSSRASLGFLRTICPDQHTTRSFEIPACGSMLLADRTKEHQEFFDEGVEADYFSSDEELIDKAVFYHQNPNVRIKIAAAGRARCVSSGYSYRDRMRTVQTWIEENRGQ